ncbi:MAG: AMIN domain-containing protein [Deltaproteobacteria bacterium]|jgi:hypothetical protein|nr:AMIN domain-containing protein [Deltaproteobacteria bacterium]
MNKTITLLIIGVVFLALLLMMFNSFRIEERQGVSAPVAEKTRPSEDAPPARIEERIGVAPVLAPSAPEAPGSASLAPPAPKAAPQATESAAAGRASSAEGVTVKTVPAQIDAGHTAPAGFPPQAAASPRTAPPRAPAMPEPGAGQTSGGTKNITTAVVYVTQEGATLRLGGDRPLVYTSMLLRNPDRLVLDFEGHWNVSAPGVPQNKLIKAVRVGRQTDSTRMVVDLHRAPASYRLIKSSPQGLDVRLR